MREGLFSRILRKNACPLRAPCVSPLIGLLTRSFPESHSGFMRDNNGRKGVINFIVKLITPDMRRFNINVLHVEASNTEGTLAFVRHAIHYTPPPPPHRDEVSSFLFFTNSNLVTLP